MSRWLTASQILELELPALPNDKGGLSRFISRHGWRSSPLAREIDGTWEYHSTLFPAEAQATLIARSAATFDGPKTDRDAAAWERYERLPETSRTAARDRLVVVNQVSLLRSSMSASVAVALAAKEAGISTSSLWGWLKLVEGVTRANWLPVLAPAYKGRTATADCDPRAWDFFVADYLRPEQPALSSCYQRLQESAAKHGWSPIPSLKTLQRRLEKQVPAAAQTLARKGRDAAARVFPHQTRDRSGFRAMQAVNADGHRFDVFVRWTDGTIGRPTMTAIQDLATGMIVGYRLAESESWASVRLAFADMVERYGIPEECWLDNGRAFASKWLTGGQKSRYRFKIKDEEPRGVLTSLGIRVHWATPYHGQAKPIERAFRDFCEETAKHPAFAGAYVGNNPTAKPDNYGSKAVPIGEFRTILASEVARHNTREGRRGNGLSGESFATAFARSLSEPGNVITRATAAQRRLLLLAAEAVTCRKPTGEIQLGGNRYWADALVAHMGRTVTVRFDPDDLHAPIAVYTARDGRLICEAPAIETTGFADSEAAGAHSRDKRRWLKQQRDLLDTEKRLSIDDVANLMPRLPQPEAPVAPVIRLVTPATTQLPSNDDQAAAQASFSRGIRALADRNEGDVIPIRAAETG